MANGSGPTVRWVAPHPMGRNANGAAKPKFPRAPDYPRDPRLCIAAGNGSHQVEINQSIRIVKDRTDRDE